MTIIINVFDEQRIASVQGFCDVAVRIVSGMPTLGQLDVFDEYAIEDLDGDIRGRALAGSEEVRLNLPTGNYETSGVVFATGDACGRYDLEGVMVTP